MLYNSYLFFLSFNLLLSKISMHYPLNVVKTQTRRFYNITISQKFPLSEKLLKKKVSVPKTKQIPLKKKKKELHQDPSISIL